MHIAVIGAGFAGLSVTAHLFLLFPRCKVTLFDPLPIGENTSGNSSGLMHYFVGEKAKKSWKGELCFEESKKLLMLSEENLKEEVFVESPFFRACHDPKTKEILYQRSQSHSELEWIPFEKAKSMGYETEGFLIRKAAVVYAKKYLRGLFAFCEKHDFELKEKRFDSKAVNSFEHIFFCAGEAIPDYFSLPFKTEKIKGDMIVCRSKECALPMPLVGKGHITKTDIKEQFWIGGTYEKNYTSMAPNHKKIEELKNRLSTIYPQISSLALEKIQSGVRLCRKGVYLPFLIKQNENVTLLGGFGSRGLLYHGYFGKMAVSLFAESFYKRSKGIKE